MNFERLLIRLSPPRQKVLFPLEHSRSRWCWPPFWDLMCVGSADMLQA